jgi:glutamate-1-semialdehyde 2,1-aminomutase
MLSREGTYPGLYSVGDSAIAGLREVFRRHHIHAIVQGFGPMFQIYFTERTSLEDYRDYCTYVDLDRYSRFVQKLMDYGIYMTPSNGLHWIISTAHRDQDVAALLEAVDQTCAQLA